MSQMGPWWSPVDFGVLGVIHGNGGSTVEEAPNGIWDPILRSPTIFSDARFLRWFARIAAGADSAPYLRSGSFGWIHVY
jgi:hypothetical protein